MFKLPNDIKQLFRQIGIFFEHVHVVGIGVAVNVRLHGDKAIVRFLLGRLKRLFSV